MEINSEESLLAWLKEKPRTYEWGAVLAYGRDETNNVLLQQYINGFGSSNHLKPITEEIRDNTTPTQKEFIHNYQMDSPRLSFLGSNLNSSAAKLTMRVVGGTHVSFFKTSGSSQWNVSRIAHEDALDGSKLDFYIDLMASPGTVDSAGRVLLNIAEGKNYELNYLQTPHLRKVAGAHFQEVFRPLPDDQKIFVLNELKFEKNQLLKPKSFVVRTHNKKESGTRLGATEDEGEGAVVLFVEIDGDGRGFLPVDNKDLRYLIPDGKSATVLLKHEMMKERVLVEGMRKVNQQPVAYEYTDIIQDGKVFGIRGRKGGLEEPFGLVSVTRFDIDVPDFKMDFYNVASPEFPLESFFLTTMPGWDDGAGNVDGLFRLIVFAGKWMEGTLRRVDNTSMSVPGLVWFGCSVVQEFELSVDVHGLVFTPRFSIIDNKRTVVDVSDKLREYLPSGYADSLRPALKDKMISCLSSALSRFGSSLVPIDVYILNSLLFRGDNAVNLESIHTPMDWAMFGHVGPTLTTFTIKQMEPVVGHSETFDFTTDPPRNDLKWAVHNILGETVPVGSINATTGRYTAPTAAQLEGSFVRVRVTASAGIHTSSALVTVMRRGITVNPQIQVATAGDSFELDVSAGTIDGGLLTWSIEEPASGATVKPNPNGDHSYKPGPSDPKSPPTIDKIVVHNPRTKLSETANVLVVHRPAYLDVVIVDKPGLPDNQIQLAINGENGPIDPGKWGESWQVLVGSGSAQIDAVTGLLTVNPNGPDNYVVITVLAPPGREGQPPDDGYIILPLPLFSVPETIRMLCTDDQ